ncbi:hypothetical protein CHUAL_004123 [Chamberlinius hualienensis]
MGVWSSSRSSTWLLVTIAIATTIKAQDGRCYLKEGSSSASFSVSENLSIGGILGVLEVGGNASRGGDIQLSLQEVKRRNWPNMIHILPETKQLILTGKLDKEGVEGPSQLHVQVKCERLSGNDPAIVIPVRIVVQDANDNAPAFINAPYILQLNEAMTPGMVISSDIIRAIDRDQPGPFNTIHYSVEDGRYSDHLAFQSPLGQTLIIKKQLDYETLPNFTVTIKAEDQGNPPLYNRTTITIKVLDADDQNPRFMHQSYYATIPKTNQPGDLLKIEPSTIKAEDQDKGINVSVVYSLDSETMDSHYFIIDAKSGSMFLNASVPLDIAFPITLVIRATQADNIDKRDLATLSINRISGFNGLRFISSSYHIKIPENLPNDSILLRLQTNRPFDEHLKFNLKNDYHGQFEINQSGDLILKKPMDFEVNQKIVLEATVISGSMKDTTRVELQMINVNEHDPKFNSGLFRFRASARSIETSQAIGRIPAEDADLNDHVTISLMGPNARAFRIDQDGNLFVKNVTLLNSSISHLVAIASDDGLPPRKSSVPIEVIVPEELIATATMLSANSAFFIMIIFGISLAILFVIIIILSIYIAKRNRKRDRVCPSVFPNHQPMAKMATYTANPFSHQKLSTPTAQTAVVDNISTNCNASEPSFSSSASLSTFISPNCNRQQHFHMTKKQLDNSTAILMDSPGSARRLMVGYQNNNLGHSNSIDSIDTASEIENDDEDYEDDDDDDVEVDSMTSPKAKRIFVKSKPKRLDPNSAKRSSLKVLNEEKRRQIPKKVKKLSWEDEQTNKQATDMDFDANGMPFLIKRLSHPDTTVYF